MNTPTVVGPDQWLVLVAPAGTTHQAATELRRSIPEPLRQRVVVVIGLPTYVVDTEPDTARHEPRHTAHPLAGDPPPHPHKPDRRGGGADV